MGVGHILLGGGGVFVQRLGGVATLGISLPQVVVIFALRDLHIIYHFFVRGRGGGGDGLVDIPAGGDDS